MPDAITAPQGFLSPAVQKLAGEHGIDPRQIAGSGAGGRVTARDVIAAAQERNSGAANERLPAWEGDEVVDFSAIRKRTASNLRASLDTAAHALVVTEVDYLGVDRARRAAAARGVALTYLPFVARAVIDSIVRFPEVNAVVQGDSLVIRREINLGFAVDLDFKGLIVPVVHHADTLRLVTIAEEVQGLADRARRRALSADELARGTFTITNVGRYGTLMTGPIINQPQVAILSTDGVKPRPVALPDGHGGYQIAVHPVGNLSLSFDHRAFDGAYASAFVASVRDILESREWEAEL